MLKRQASSQPNRKQNKEQREEERKMAVSIRYTRNLFLRAVCVIYLFAFVSFYVQIRGLFGNDGVLPASRFLENSQKKSFWQTVHYRPTLLWLAPYLGMDTSYALEALTLFGIFLAFTGFVSQKICTIPLFAALWSVYYSIFLVGQTFVESQLDSLLLEVGFITLFISPLLPGKKRGMKSSPKDEVVMWIIRWVLFRFMFTNGLSKLMKGGTMWWDLTAYSHHFESMYMPAPLAWYTHHLPLWILKALTALTLVYEIAYPFAFLIPVQSVRTTAFVIQVLYQMTQILTSNNNITNLLIVALSITLLDDSFFYSSGSSKSSSSNSNSNSSKNKLFKMIGNIVLNLAVHALFVYGIITVFNIKFADNKLLFQKPIFTKNQFDLFLRKVLVITVIIGLASLGIRIARSFVTAVMSNSSNGIFSVFKSMISIAIVTLITMALYLTSTVPMYGLDKTLNGTLNPNLRMIYNRLSKANIVNYYGTYHPINSNGRLEIVLEGSNNIEGPWVEYNFMYKPGNVNHSLPYVAPYSPRLDWQFWFAAQTTYQENPWLLSLTHRLLAGKKDVLQLLGRNDAFVNKPPKFIRATLYNYKYTPWSQRWQQSWWKREKVREYFPAYSVDSPALIEYLKARNLLPTTTSQSAKSESSSVVNPILKQILDNIRFLSNHLEPTLFLWSIFTAGFALIVTTA